MISVIALAGIVVRNSLLLIDFMLDYMAKGNSLEDSLIEAGAVRFRPILLNSTSYCFWLCHNDYRSCIWRTCYITCIWYIYINRINTNCDPINLLHLAN
ncbi:MAG TPA: efflux RND transporter permease subunit [Desulfurella acetivorans]|uniref:Efflux RND transporter permease subunit n=1 Tax=Desulfurella acetivorans TaxID=33002 RepID=A0A7C6E942_DESAE|nr:efflux RND transporter permease subunit [Desulfurella acetivorans]